jgi:uncharacterized secreted repeat protein (TIGR03808 family)
MEFSRRTLLSAAGGMAAMPIASVAVSAQEFGLEPNAKRDQSKTLQAAIDMAAKQGGVLLLPPGKYVASGLTISKPVQIEGVPGRSTIIAKEDEFFLKIAGTANVGLRGLNFDGVGQAATKKTRSGSLVTAENVTQLIVEECGFLGGPGSGLSLERCSGRVANCEFGFVEETGLYAFDSAGLSITNNYVHDIGNNGIQVWASEKREDGTIVIGNRVERIAARDGGTGQNGNGINVWKAGNVLIANNRISDCAFSAIRNNSGSNCQILGNSISRTDEVAIYVEFAFEGAVVSNNLIENVSFGISITNFDQGGRLAVCANNLVRRVKGGGSLPDKRAVGIYAEADAAVTGNVVEDARDVGIALGWGRYGRNLMATGNLVRACGRGFIISLAEGAEGAFIANNTIAGAKIGAIFGMDHLNVVTDDLGKPGIELPGRIKVDGNVII